MPTESAVTLSDRFLNVSLSLAMAVYSFWLSTHRTWNPDYGYMKGHFGDTFFRNQAIAILHGRLNVMGPTYFTDGECFYRDGMCHGYFGVFPSLVRLPFFLIFRSTEISLAPVSIALAAGIALWASLDLLGHALNLPLARGINKTNRRLMHLATALLLGTGGSLITLSQAKVFREAIIWLVALLLLTFAMSLRWISTNESKYLIVALLTAIGATNSRPSAMPVVAGLGIWLYLRQFKRESALTINFLSLPFAMIVLPAATALLVFYAKFRAFTPPWPTYATYKGESIQRYLRLNNGTLQGLRYVPTNLAQYFRPDSVRYSLGSPWALVVVPTEKPPILVPPIVNGGMYFEPTASITNTMPLQLLLTALGAGVSLWKLRLRQLAELHPFAVLLGLATLTPIAVLTAFGNTSRYVGDFFPTLVVGTVMGMVIGGSWLDRRGWLRQALYGTIALAVLLSVVQFALNIGGWNFSG